MAVGQARVLGKSEDPGNGQDSMYGHRGTLEEEIAKKKGPKEAKLLERLEREQK